MATTLIIILILINAVFAASESSFVSFSKTTLNKEIEKGFKRAKRIKQILDKQDDFIIIIQISTLFIGFLASAFAAETYSRDIMKWISYFNLSGEVLRFAVMFIITIIVTYITLIFGEVLPRKLGVMYPKKVAYITVDLFIILRDLLSPFILLVKISTNLIYKIFKMDEKVSESITEEEIKLLITETRNAGTVDELEQNLIYNSFNFNEIKVKEIMKKIEESVLIETSMSNKEILKVVKTSKYTRIPIYKEKLTNIIGILNIKDIVINYYNEDKLVLKDLQRDPIYIKQNIVISEAFRIMQETQNSIAIVVNSKNVAVGIVSLEDILEEIVGSMFDEYKR